MPREAPDEAALWDMWRACQRVLQFIAGRSEADFEEDPFLQSAVLYQLQTIGEAARRVSMHYRDAHMDIPWSGVIGQRSVIVHDYGELDLHLIWVAASERVMLLRDQLAVLLGSA